MLPRKPTYSVRTRQVLQILQDIKIMKGTRSQEELSFLGKGRTSWNRLVKSKTLENGALETSTRTILHTI